MADVSREQNWEIKLRETPFMHPRAFKRLPRALRVNSRELGQRRF